MKAWRESDAVPEDNELRPADSGTAWKTGGTLQFRGNRISGALRGTDAPPRSVSGTVGRVLLGALAAGVVASQFALLVILGVVLVPASTGWLAVLEALGTLCLAYLVCYFAHGIGDGMLAAIAERHRRP